MDSKLRVLMISPQFRPIVGGYERAAERLAMELGRQGWKVTVVTERRCAEWPASEALADYSLRRIWCLYRPGLHMATSLASLAVFIVANGRRWDVFHVHQYGHHAAVCIVLARLMGKPVVLKATNTGPQGIRNVLAEAGRSGRILAWLHRRVDACIATSSTALDEAVEFGIPRDRVVLLPNGIDTNVFTPSGRAEKQKRRQDLGLKRSITVLFCGRLSSEKNPDGLVLAWREVVANWPDAELVIVGTGGLASRIQDLISGIGAEQSVRVVGNVADVLPWYQAADIYVLPSHHEGLSNSLLEAMSCGLPIVSTKVSGSDDLFARADLGELVPVGDSSALAAGLLALMRSESRRQACGARARALIEEGFSIQGVARATAALYERLVVV